MTPYCCGHHEWTYSERASACVHMLASQTRCSSGRHTRAVRVARAPAAQLCSHAGEALRRQTAPCRTSALGRCSSSPLAQPCAVVPAEPSFLPLLRICATPRGIRRRRPGLSQCQETISRAPSTSGRPPRCRSGARPPAGLDLDLWPLQQVDRMRSLRVEIGR